VTKIAVLALLAAGIIGWAVRDDTVSKPATTAGPPPAPGAPARANRDEFAQKVRDNASLRESLQKQHPEAWRGLAQQTRRDLATCVVTEVLPGVLKADCF